MVFRPTVKEATPGRELRWLGVLFVPGLFDGEHSFKLERLGESQVRFSQSEQFRGLLVPVFPRSMYDRARAGFEAMNHALKARVEQGE